MDLLRRSGSPSRRTYAFLETLTRSRSHRIESAGKRKWKQRTIIFAIYDDFPHLWIIPNSKLFHSRAILVLFSNDYYVHQSINSFNNFRNKRSDDHASNLRRDATNSRSHSSSGLAVPPRKPPRLAESALSSGESTTGDSSQQSQNSQRSQRSVVYLHAATGNYTCFMQLLCCDIEGMCVNYCYRVTVGEIPGPNERRRAASREELNRPLQTQTRTVSRSVSVLAPWKPRHYREPFEINYEQQQQKPVATMRRRHRSRETLSRRGKEARRSRDNLSKTGNFNDQYQTIFRYQMIKVLYPWSLFVFRYDKPQHTQVEGQAKGG